MAEEQQQHQLNVRDAMSYLDEVKNQFRDDPQIYSAFLDTMRDFKKGRLDTPGVINRVSTLFKEHPVLIQGFNTFLPPGYRIDLTGDPNNPVRITTPSWAPIAPGASSEISSQASPIHPPQSQLQTQSHIVSQPPIQQVQQLQPQSLQQQATQPSITFPVKKEKGTLEFNHAIHFVNKIKNRFAAEPETYKAFLEVLQTYQRESRPIGDVYAQVRTLFKDAPDLVDEFKMFLPESGYKKQQARQPPTVGTFPVEIKKSTSNFSIGSTSGLMASVAARETAQQHKRTRQKQSNQQPQSQQQLQSQQQPHSVQHIGSRTATAEMRKVKTRPLVPAVMRPVGEEELEFFDRVKKMLQNKQVYGEFLKIINLFSQEIIDRRTLLERAIGFLGKSPDLLEWFKEVINWNEQDESIENVSVPLPTIDISKLPAFGTSYRKLPTDIEKAACSGRDALCEDVLNDDYVSHPTWASEESGFSEHKKNSFEEAIHKNEEERYEFDIHIEAARNVISLLEPIQLSIENMSVEERNNYRLPEGLGGTSKSIYKRLVRKMYGNEKAFDLIDSLHNSPAIAVPVILKRLKQKYEEWRTSQREWNKVWREQDNKNYYKSLDYQGINFKHNERKIMIAKQFITEIEVVKKEQHEKWLATNLPSVRYQLDYKFKDSQVLLDVIRLIYSYLYSVKATSPGHGTSIPVNDRADMETFISKFILLFLSIDSVGAQQAGDYQKKKSESNAMDTKEEEEDDETDVEMADANGVESDPRSYLNRAPSPRPEEEVQHRSYSMFANNSFYVFFRLFQLVYERLEKMKVEGQKLLLNPNGNDHINQVAVDLLLVRPAEPSVPVDQFYSHFLSLIEKMFSADIEQNKFEEEVRTMFGLNAYLSFNIDTIVRNLVKHIHTMIVDAKTMELFSFFHREKNNDVANTRQQSVYKMSAETVIGRHDNVYRIEYYKDHSALTVQLLGKDDFAADAHISAEEKWSFYIDRYMQLAATDETITEHTRPVCLKRNLPKDISDEPLDDVISHSALDVKICVNTYKIFFVENTEDYFYRINMPPIDDARLEALRDARRANFEHMFVEKFQELEEDGWHSMEDGEKQVFELFRSKGKSKTINENGKELWITN